MTRRLSRRQWLASAPALGGLLLSGCSREQFMPPVVRGGLIGAADVLTMSTNRLLLSGQPLAREYSRSEIADPFPTWNQTNPKNPEYQQHLAEGFRNWQLSIGGLVGCDLFEVQHPQTILAYGLKGRDLPTGNGAPLRMRVERQCGYKNMKFVRSVRVVDSVAGIGKGTGGINSDIGFHWYAGV